MLNDLRFILPLDPFDLFNFFQIIYLIILFGGKGIFIGIIENFFLLGIRNIPIRIQWVSLLYSFLQYLKLWQIIQSNLQVFFTTVNELQTLT